MGEISPLLDPKHHPLPPVHRLGTVVLDAHLLDQLLELVGFGLEVDGTRADDLVTHAVERGY